MTHHTDAERAEFEATFAKLYDDWVFDAMSNSAAKRAAFLVWQAARRAPAAPVLQGWKLVPEESTEAMARAFRADDAPYYFAMTTIRCNDFAARYRAALAAAPQPPEAAQSISAEFDGIKKEGAPVELPEPSAWMLGCQTMGGDVGWILSWSKSGAGVCHRLSGEEFEHPLYTEQQVRDLMAAHGIGKDKA